jgi:capsular exopolysaccharide synthesis family protein
LPSKPDNAFAPPDFDESSALPDWGERLLRIYFESKRLLASWWWVLLLAVSAGIGWQAYSELNRDPVYVSQSEMMISGRFALPDSVYREERSNFFGTQISLMLSTRVQQQARERVTMLNPEMPQSWVRLAVNQRPQASIFQLQAEGGDPQFTQEFLDAVMEEYQTFRREMRSETTESTLLAVTEQLYRLEEAIEAQENTVVDFQKENNLIFLKEQDSSTGAYLARLTTQQAEMKTQLLILENLESADMGTFPAEQSPLVQTESFALLEQTRQERTQLEAQLEEYSLYLKPKHPKIINIELFLERAANLIDILDRQTIQSLNERKEQLRRQIRNLDAVIVQWEKQALSISRKSAEFERLQYRLERSRNTYQRLLDSIQAIQSNQNIEQETVGILAPASRASVRAPEITKQVTEGAVTGLLFGISIIAAISFFDVRIRSSDELAKRFDFPLIGIILDEEHNEAGQVDLLQLEDRRHRFAEACRTLRSSILLHDSENSVADSRCILVSSSTPNEGKSTISANLAIALSYINKRVLLIDADMRQGGIHKLFSLKLKRGLSDLLRGEDEFGSFTHETDYANLDLINNGDSHSNSGELLLSERMDELLNWAKKHYAYIIIDVPPILAVDDTMGLASKADSMLMVVRANQTSARQVQSSLNRLSIRASKIIGFVFNCAPTGGVDYYYYYRHYDSYHQQAEAATNSAS